MTERGLTELHRSALELAEHAEELGRRACLHLGRHGLSRRTTHPFAQAHGHPARMPQWQAGQTNRSGQRARGMSDMSPLSMPVLIGCPAFASGVPQEAGTRSRRS